MVGLLPDQGQNLADDPGALRGAMEVLHCGGIVGSAVVVGEKRSFASVSEVALGTPKDLVPLKPGA